MCNGIQTLVSHVKIRLFHHLDLHTRSFHHTMKSTTPPVLALNIGLGRGVCREVYEHFSLGYLAKKFGAFQSSFLLWLVCNAALHTGLAYYLVSE